jgi:hypothetical protein
MMNDQLLAKNLQLSIWLENNGTGEEFIRIELEDPLAMLQTEYRYELNVTTLPNQVYHLREAIIIAMRRLMAQAISQGLIQVNYLSRAPGVLTKLKTQRRLAKPPGVEADITLSIDEELL